MGAYMKMDEVVGACEDGFEFDLAENPQSTTTEWSPIIAEFADEGGTEDTTGHDVLIFVDNIYRGEDDAEGARYAFVELYNPTTSDSDPLVLHAGTDPAEIVPLFVIDMDPDIP